MDTSPFLNGRNLCRPWKILCPRRTGPISKARAQKQVRVHSEVMQVLHYFAEETKEREGRRGGGRGWRRKEGGKDRDSQTNSHWGTLS